ncbi:hypothetical protein E2C01_031643 [Portunus trituberculatus]|uniref:Uncharacterized protein n=1 Tax=Portunus trituberculatus TaxID=210409 RepID=A0A5B7EYN6_PORTR|nr:hypothetical protein [Portunus trituberculatus]
MCQKSRRGFSFRLSDWHPKTLPPRTPTSRSLAFPQPSDHTPPSTTSFVAGSQSMNGKVRVVEADWSPPLCRLRRCQGAIFL